MKTRVSSSKVDQSLMALRVWLIVFMDRLLMHPPVAGRVRKTTATRWPENRTWSFNGQIPPPMLQARQTRSKGNWSHRQLSFLAAHEMATRCLLLLMSEACWAQD